MPSSLPLRKFSRGLWLTPRGLRELESLELWREDARLSVEDIGGWRGHECRRDDTNPRTRWQDPPEPLRADAETIVAAAERLLPQLDVQPILDITEWIMRWYERRSAADLPPQRELESRMERALIGIDVLIERLRATAVDYPVRKEPDVEGRTGTAATAAPVRSSCTIGGDMADLTPYSLTELTELLAEADEAPETKPAHDDGGAPVLRPGTVRERIRRASMGLYHELAACEGPDGFERQAVDSLIAQLAWQRAADIKASAERRRALAALKAAQAAGIVSLDPTRAHTSAQEPTAAGD